MAELFEENENWEWEEGGSTRARHPINSHLMLRVSLRARHYMADI